MSAKRSTTPQLPRPTDRCALFVSCPCGAVHCFTVEHYGVGRAKCGRSYWALQPKRGEPMKLFPWPGPNLTAQELAEKEKGNTDEAS